MIARCITTFIAAGSPVRNPAAKKINPEFIMCQKLNMEAMDLVEL